MNRKRIIGLTDRKMRPERQNVFHFVSRDAHILVSSYRRAKSQTISSRADAIRQVFDCRPGMIIKNFSLTNPSFKYHELTNYGHFGRPDLDLPWEKLDKVDEIKALLK